MTIDTYDAGIRADLARLVRSDRTVHAFAFIGGSTESRKSLGQYFAKLLLCSEPGQQGPCGTCLSCRKFEHGNHEDLIFIQKPEDRESIVKDQILDVISRMEYKSFGGRYVVLIEDAQLMNPAAQNKLLKTLEEPVSPAVIILLTPVREALLPTVLSRCQQYTLESPAPEISDELKKQVQQFTKLILNRAPYYRKKDVLSPILDAKDDSRAQAAVFLDALEETIRNVLVNNAMAENKPLSPAQSRLLIDAVRHVETARQYIKQVHNTAYTLKQMCLRV